MHNSSFECADHLSTLFVAMFLDPTIALISHLNTPRHEQPYVRLLIHNKKPVMGSALKFPFSLLRDESNEKGDTVKLFTILIRSYKCENSSVVTRHLDIVGITCVTAADIFQSIEDVVLKYGLDFSNVISFVSDTCNVMRGVRNGMPLS